MNWSATSGKRGNSGSAWADREELKKGSDKHEKKRVTGRQGSVTLFFSAFPEIRKPPQLSTLGRLPKRYREIGKERSDPSSLPAGSFFAWLGRQSCGCGIRRVKVHKHVRFPVSESGKNKTALLSGILMGAIPSRIPSSICHLGGSSINLIISRSSDLRIQTLLSLPDFSVVFERRSPLTAARQLRIYTGFPFHLFLTGTYNVQYETHFYYMTEQP